jgi:hypothetical protein
LVRSSSRGASPDVTIQNAEEGTKGGKKRCKQRRLETMVMNGDDSINKQAAAPTWSALW